MIRIMYCRTISDQCSRSDCSLPRPDKPRGSTIYSRGLSNVEQLLATRNVDSELTQLFVWKNQTSTNFKNDLF
jgi:hypothetical protein